MHSLQHFVRQLKRHLSDTRFLSHLQSHMDNSTCSEAEKVIDSLGYSFNEHATHGSPELGGRFSCFLHGNARSAIIHISSLVVGAQLACFRIDNARLTTIRLSSLGVSALVLIDKARSSSIRLSNLNGRWKEAAAHPSSHLPRRGFRIPRSSGRQASRRATTCASTSTLLAKPVASSNRSLLVLSHMLPGGC